MNEMAHIKKLEGILESFGKKTYLMYVFSFFLWIIVGHIIFNGAMGYFSSRFPLNPIFLESLIFGKWIYLIMFPIGIFFWIQIKGNTKKYAQKFDNLNPQLHEGFQTIFSLENHSAKTLNQLDSLYASGLKIFNPIKGKRISIVQIITLIAAGGVWVGLGTATGNFSDYFTRNIHPNKVKQALPLLEINLTTDHLKLGKGDTANFHGEFQNLVGQQTIYAHLVEAEKEQRFQLKLIGNQTNFKYGPVEKDFSVFFKGENGISKTIQIKVLQKPYITSVTTIRTPPGYTGLPVDTLPAGQLQLNVLNGSKITWQLKTNRKIKSYTWMGEILNTEPKWNYSKTPTNYFEISRNFNRFSKDSTMETVKKFPYPYGIQIVDEFNILGDQSTLGRITEEKDLPPTVVILNPLDGDLISQTKKIPLQIEVDDDYGISILQLRYKVLSDGMTKDSIKTNIRQFYKKGKKEIFYDWDLSNTSLFPDNMVRFSLLACDNNKIKGRQCVVSDEKEIRFPSIRELMAQVEEKEQHSIHSLKGALSKQQLLQKKMERVKASDEGPQDFRSQFEIRKILSSDPKRLLRHGKNILKLHEKKLKELPRDIKSFKNTLKNFENKIPAANIERENPAKQLKALKKLNREEQKVVEKLKDLEKKLSKKNELKPVNNRVKSLKKDLQKNLAQQNDLKEYLKSKVQKKDFEKSLKKEVAEGQKKVMEEVDEALKNIQELMKESAEKGVFNDSLLSKLEKIQDLLSEILPDSVRDMLQKKMSGEKLDAQSLEEGLRNILKNQEKFEENINQALRMLEKLKKYQRLEAFKKSLSEIMKNQDALNKKIKKDIDSNKGTSSSKEKDKQTGLRNEFSKMSKDLKKESFLKSSPSLDSMLKKNSIQKEMKKSEKSLQQKSKSGLQQAHKSGQKAQKQMGAMAQMLNDLSMQMEGPQNQIDLALLKRLTEESLQLSHLQNLAKKSETDRINKGWDRTPSSLYGSGFKVSRWIYQTLTRMSESSPYISRYMRMQAQQLAAELDGLSKGFNPSKANKSLEYNQNLTRELLKLLNQAQQGGGGAGSGQASGSNNPQDGMGNLSQQLKGMSGKQLSVNTATRQLLKSMMNARRQNRGRQQGGKQQGGRQSGSQQGKGSQQSQGNGKTGLGESANQLANQQGQLGEQLESMAEATPGNEGVSGKLRRLAKEARELEKQIRGGVNRRLVQRQSQFKARMLETVNSLRKKGYSSKRESKSSKIQWGNSTVNSVDRSKWVLQIERELKKIRKMDLETREMEALENYFKSLLIQ